METFAAAFGAIAGADASSTYAAAVAVVVDVHNCAVLPPVAAAVATDNFDCKSLRNSALIVVEGS